MSASSSEARLRIRQAVERASDIQRALDDLHILANKSNSDEVKNQKVRFITPQEITISQSRWDSYCVSTTRQLYGLNQKVTLIKRNMSCNQQDISMIRLVAQASLNASSLLKGLLQFPEEVTRAGLSVTNDGGTQKTVVVRVVTVCSELLQLMDLAGIVSTNAAQALDSSSNSSVVESEVVEALQAQGRVAYHLTALAAHRLGSKPRSPATLPRLPTIRLPNGRTLHTVQDSLSCRLLGAPADQESVHKFVTKSTKLHKRPQTHLPSPKINNSLRTKRVTTHRYSRSQRRKSSSRKPEIVSIETSKKTTSDSSSIASDTDEDDQSVEEREALWEELMPLLLHQEVLLNGGAEEDWDGVICKLDQLLERVTALECAALQGCEQPPTNEDSDGETSLADTIDRATNLLQSTGFLAKSKVLSEHARGSPTRCSDAQATGCGGACYCVDHGDCLVNERQGDQLNRPTSLVDEFRQQREEFWAGLATGGFVEV